MFTTENLLFNLLFTVLGAALGALFGNIFSKPNESCNINRTEIIIREIDQGRHEYESNKLSTSRTGSKSSSGNNISIASIVGVAILIVILYAKYHDSILRLFISSAIVILVSTIVFVSVLAVRKSLDELSRYWLIVTIILEIINIINIAFMSEQDLSMDNFVKSFGRILYYSVGALFLAFANILALCSYMYIISVNVYLKWNNKFTCKIMHFFDGIYENRQGITILLVFLVAISLLMSSGLLAKWIEDISDKNMNDLFDITNSTQH